MHTPVHINAQMYTYVNGTDTAGRTAMHIAAAEGHMGVCEVLAAFGYVHMRVWSVGEFDRSVHTRPHTHTHTHYTVAPRPSRHNAARTAKHHCTAPLSGPTLAR